jgi:hypothetical protein
MATAHVRLSPKKAYKDLSKLEKLVGEEAAPLVALVGLFAIPALLQMGLILGLAFLVIYGSYSGYMLYCRRKHMSEVISRHADREEKISNCLVRHAEKMTCRAEAKANMRKGMLEGSCPYERGTPEYPAFISGYSAGKVAAAEEQTRIEEIDKDTRQIQANIDQLRVEHAEARQGLMKASAIDIFLLPAAAKLQVKKLTAE